MHEGQSSLRREALFSVIARRVVGPAFFFGGIIIGGYFVVQLAQKGSLVVEGQPSNDWFVIAVSVLLPAVVTVLGLLLQRAKPHYIDE